jgi:polar amino acid transport system substrate-binding protein
MKQVSQNYRSGELAVRLVPSPSLRPAGVLVRNHASLISAGTEKTKVDTARMNLVAKARSRPDQVRKVLETLRREGYASTYRKVMGKLDALSPLGYSTAGVVSEVGAEASEFRVGDRVACAGVGFANHAEVVYVPRNLCVAIPDRVSFAEAAFTTVGAIALQGVRQAEVRLGERVGVIGLGLVGQLTTMLLKAAGCQVIGIDIDPWCVEVAAKSGAEVAVVRGADPVARAGELSGGMGLDAVIITAGTRSNDPVHLAAKLLRDRGRVVVVGAVGMALERELFYIKELDIRLSRSYGPGRYDVAYEEKGRDYPVGYVRWTEKRNMEAFLQLVARGAISLEHLTTHRVPVDEAPRAYDLLAGKVRDKFLGIVLEYQPDRPLEDCVSLKVVSNVAGKQGMGFIGAGSFAKSVILPHLREVPLRGIHTASGLTAVDVGEKHDFAFAAGTPEGVMEDPQTGAVFIATRHDSHAPLVVAALEKGLAVFVEKPLALDDEQLARVEVAVRATGGLLTVGFNRRFAPLARKARDHFANRTYPLAVNMRVNAGAIPPDSWIQDPEVGGGRIVGEVCHFIDLAQYLCGARIRQVYAAPLFDKASGQAQEDSVSIVLTLDDGSVSTVQYLANGDPGLAKERIEVFGGGKVAVLDDFRHLSLWQDGREQVAKAPAQDKGHRDEVKTFLAATRTGVWPISLEELVNTTRASFRIRESLRSCRPVDVDG